MKTMSTKDALELSVESYIQGYKDAINVLQETSKNMTVDGLLKDLQKKIDEKNKEAGAVVRE